MFQLNEEFLKELGLDQLPEDQQKSLLQHIYSELELRVGERLSQGMSDAQLEEFAGIIDKTPGAVDDFLMKHAPNYQQEPMLQKMSQASGLPVDDPRLKDEFAATKWLEVNRPDYRDVVAAVMADLKKEIIANKCAEIRGAHGREIQPRRWSYAPYRAMNCPCLIIGNMKPENCPVVLS